MKYVSARNMDMRKAEYLIMKALFVALLKAGLRSERERVRGEDGGWGLPLSSLAGNVLTDMPLRQSLVFVLLSMFVMSLPSYLVYVKPFFPRL